MKQLITILFALVCITTSAQQGNAPSESQRKKQEEQIAKRKSEYINSIVADLNIDEFQQHILKQRLNTYFETKVKIINAQKPYYEKEQEIQDLNATYFEDLKGAVPEEAIESVKKTLTNPQEKDKKKKKKKKKKRKNKD